MPVFPEPLVTDTQINALVLNLHEALAAGTASVLEQQSLFFGLLAHLVVRYAENRPALRTLGAENNFHKKPGKW